MKRYSGRRVPINFTKYAIHTNDKIKEFINSIPNNKEHFDINKIELIKSCGIISRIDLQKFISDYIKYNKLFKVNENGEYIKSEYELDDVLKKFFDFKDGDKPIAFCNIVSKTSDIVKQCELYSSDDNDY